jgi:hypothetical protein
VESFTAACALSFLALQGRVCRALRSENNCQENQLAKPNYRHAKKQKEAARKARQDAKQQRRSNVPEAADALDVPVQPAPAKPVG